MARSYTSSAYGSVPAGRSISARETWRKLSGLPCAIDAASSLVTTSYGTAATSLAAAGVGRSARKGKSAATSRIIRVGYDEAPRVEGNSSPMTPLVFIVAIAITAVVSAIIVRALAGRQLAE